MNILLVEDDLDLGNGTRIALADSGESVVWVRRLADAQQALQQGGFDLVLLDLGLPDGDGVTLLTSLRRQEPRLPVLILSARDALEDRLRGLDGGADDYLVKPFALEELRSRVRAVARRVYGVTNDLMEVRGLVVNQANQRVEVDGRRVELSRSEYLLLGALLKRLDRVVTRRTLEAEVLPLGGSESNALEVHISNLRRKIGPGFVRTVRGVGYVIDRVAEPTSGDPP